MLAFIAGYQLGCVFLKNIENIIKQEHDAAGCLEILMPMIQTADLWKESGRYDAYGPEMLRVKDRHDRDMLFGPTNEEMITDIVRGTIKSYKKLPRTLYHTQWKFRDEIRPRFGVMRGREFLMKDAYSFDIDEASSKENYQKMMIVYLRTFKKLGLQAIPMRADTGPIGGDLSHEFLVLAPTGESAVYFDKDFYDTDNIDLDINLDDKDAINNIYDKVTNLYAVSDEQYNESEFFDKVNEEKRVVGRGIEVGHIFCLGTKYSEAMNALIVDPNDQDIPVHMGCYGIGVSRLVGAIIEANHDDNGIIWPAHIAPFHIGLINLRHNSEETKNACEKLYTEFHNAGLTVLYHDTDDRAGAKFADFDLIGLPYQVVIGPKGVEKNIAEIKDRRTGEKKEIPLEQVTEYLKKIILT